MEYSIFVPGHITGFFQIIDNINPLKKGSRGSGVVLNKGVTTHLKIDEGKERVKVKINGEKDDKNASVTRKTVDLIISKFNLEDLSIEIDHEVDVPIGAGFGTSASGALGTSLSIVKALKLPLSYYDAASIAHIAEVEMMSGLGDVIAEIMGGIVIRTREGAPGIGMTDKVITEDLYVITKTLGKLDTASIIDHPQLKEKISSTGKIMIQEIINNPYPDQFMDLSYKFALETSLINEEVLEIVEIMKEESIGASMAMLGNTAFSLSEKPESSLENVLVSKIDFQGPRFINQY
ncbi:MAG: pantoate kinase [Methanobacteriaceae archaeon]|nr:pantoate kinase [Methanobacteriaceae archaeon]